LKRNVRGAIFYVFLVVVIVLGAELIIGVASGGSPAYVIVSPSMAPTLEVGDLVVVRSVSFSSIHVGDVIVFARPTAGGTCGDEILVHRVVGIVSNGGLVTQGDDRQTNPVPDEPTQWPYVTADCVRGEVMMSIPYLGSVSTAFPPPYDYILMAAILILIFLIEFLGGKESNKSSTVALNGVDSVVILPSARAATCGIVRRTDGSGSGRASSVRSPTLGSQLRVRNL